MRTSHVRSLIALGALSVWPGSFAAGCTAPPPPVMTTASDPIADGIAFRTIADHVHVMWPAPREGKVVIVEFATFVALIEAPRDDQTVRELLSEIQKRFPDKPVRYVFHTHHHAHSINAVDPLLAIGAQIVTSPANLTELCKLTANESLLRQRTIVITDRFELADQANRLCVEVLHQGSGENQWQVPTPEYMVFELPLCRTLVSGCLYNKPATYHEVVNSRKRALLAYIAARRPQVQSLIPTNTCESEGFEDFCSVQMLRDSIEQGIKPEEISARFGGLTPDEMRSQADQIAAEFKQRTPRSYDMQVCASQLAKDTHIEHAIILLEVAIRLFPADASPRFQAGEYLLQLGRRAEAEARWAEAIDHAKSPRERDELVRSVREARAGAP